MNPSAITAVFLFCSCINLIGAALGIKPPPLIPWFVGWAAAALIAGYITA